jgi:prophage regulatory protein
MHPTKILRPKQLPEITGISLATIWRLRKRNDFPTPLRLSPKAVGWDQRDIQQWIEDRRGSEVRGRIAQ